MATRRKLKKRLRESHGLNRVLDERRELEEKRAKRKKKIESKPPSSEDVMWSGWMEEVKRRSKGDEGRKDEFQPTPRHLIGLVTHQVPEFTKSRSYPHQPLSNP